MPQWKAQTPIEVFEGNDVSVDARSGAERLGSKHRYHVGDSRRRKHIDKAGFRDDTAIESGKNQSRAFSGFGGSVPFPSPLGLASVPGSPEKSNGDVIRGGGAGFSALMRQSSADERDLARDLMGPPPPPSPFAARRKARSGAVGVGAGGSPPRSPTRARPLDDEVPSRPSSPAFGSREENPDSVRTWGASDAGKLSGFGGGPSPPAPTRPVPARPPSKLQRSQSMGSFADDVFDEAGEASLAAANGAAAGKPTHATRPRRGSSAGGPRGANGFSAGGGGGGGEARPAVWDVFGGDRDKGAKK